MSGIAGIVDITRILPDHQEIQKMISTLAHRGLDKEEIWCGVHSQLASRSFNRDKEQQITITYLEKTYAIVFDGEFVNAKEVKKALQEKGYIFNTDTYAEIVGYAYIEWQHNCVQHLQGTITGTIWDEQQQALFLFRDRIGVKPLFYTTSAKTLLFASEIKALLAHEPTSPIVSYDSLTTFLSIGPSRIPGKTVYKNIFEVKPAHCLLWNKEGLQEWRYWDIESKEHTDSLKQTIEQVRELVTVAVKRQLMDDSEICTMLSGGLDSSIITAIIAREWGQQGQKLHTFSVDYEGNEEHFAQNDFQTTRDAYWIECVQQAFQTEHKEVILEQQALLEHLQQVLQAKDYPSMVDIDSSLYLFLREIKKQFPIVLSGEGADEVFGGYPWFYQDVQRFPWIRSSTERSQLLRQEWQLRLPLQQRLEEVYEQSISKLQAMDERQQLFYLNNEFFMQTLLERKERMSAAVSIEARLPFADVELLQYVWNIPWEMKTVGGFEKGILRKSFESILPNEVVYRKKNPYPKTYHPAYTLGVQKMLKERLQNPNSILHELFDPENIQQLVESKGASFGVPWFGQLMAGPQLLAFFVQIDQWFEQYNIQLVE